jgi:FAD:protein FMN transferase
VYRPTRREMIQTGLASVGALGLVQNSSAVSAMSEFSFHYDHILGTSLDVLLETSDRNAAATAEGVILEEIERLRRVFSTFDPASELSRLNVSSGPMPASADLIAVLREYEIWGRRSGGAFSAQLGDEMGRPGWAIDAKAGTVTRLSQRPLNLNSAAKGYIIGRAAAAAQERVPDLGGLLLNLGGDMHISGGDGCLIGVQDPHHPEANARPLTLLRLNDAAVATSGGYQRDSHLIDPRTGRTAAKIAGATVVAADCVTANILATTLCILSPDDGLRLIADTPGASCLIVTENGEQIRSPGFAAVEVPTNTPDPDPRKDRKIDDWPADFRVSIKIELPQIGGGRYRRPYVAVWIENADGKPVRSITVWGNDRKWLKDLSIWWKIGKDDAALVKAVTRATRAPGKYEVVWDGKDDKGETLGQGTYTIKVEVHREHGRHLTQTGKLECKAKPAKITLDKNAETEATVVEYGKKK